MMPLSIGEICHEKCDACFLEKASLPDATEDFAKEISRPLGPEIIEACDELFRYGPFPEPFLKQNDRFCRKWHQDYISLI